MVALIILFGIAVVIGLIPAAIASSKGHNFGAWWFYGSHLFIFAFFHALFIGSAYRCPHCAEGVREEAKVCPHCQRDLVQLQQTV
jgi:hypothetical protein